MEIDMIKHSTTDEAQCEASSLRTPRQEVTIGYYLEHCIDAPFWRWNGDASDYGMDSWTFYEDFPIDPESAQERGWRIFVQVRDLPG
jgi:hypothetical protein